MSNNQTPGIKPTFPPITGIFYEYVNGLGFVSQDTTGTTVTKVKEQSSHPKVVICCLIRGPPVKARGQKCFNTSRDVNSKKENSEKEMFAGLKKNRRGRTFWLVLPTNLCLQRHQQRGNWGQIERHYLKRSKNGGPCRSYTVNFEK